MKKDKVVLFFAMILYRSFFPYWFLKTSIVSMSCYIFLFLLREYEDEFNDELIYTDILRINI